MLTNTGEKFSIEICGVTFASNSTQNNIHCYIQGKNLTLVRYVVQHFLGIQISNNMLSYTGEKLFHCEICGIKFAQKSYLKKHPLTHMGKKAFLCECIVLHLSRIKP